MWKLRSTNCWTPRRTSCAGAKRYERSPERMDTRAGHYERKLHTKAGEVKYEIDERWDIDASVKWIMLDSDVNLGSATLTEARLNPFLFSFGAIYKF